MQVVKYKAFKPWAGCVWVWDVTLNNIPEDGAIEINYNGGVKRFTRAEIHKMVADKIIRKKSAFNPKLDKNGTQYGFPTKDFTN